MSSKVTYMVWTLVVAISFSIVSAKSLESSEEQPFPQNQLEYQPDEASLENALVRYLLTKEWLSRPRIPMEIDERQKKRSYWKQCAFNAVSCFGK